MQKTCQMCSNTQSVKFFPKDSTRKSGYKNICKECNNKKQKEARRLNPERAKEHDRKKYLKLMKNNPDQILNQTIKSRYGITLNKYNEMLKKQNNKCAICKKTPEQVFTAKDHAKRLYIDHCHITKHVRGLLCRNCNLGLGMFNENPDAIYNAYNYIVENILKTEF